MHIKSFCLILSLSFLIAVSFSYSIQAEYDQSMGISGIFSYGRIGFIVSPQELVSKKNLVNRFENAVKKAIIIYLKLEGKYPVSPEELYEKGYLFIKPWNYYYDESLDNSERSGEIIFTHEENSLLIYCPQESSGPPGMGKYKFIRNEDYFSAIPPPPPPTEEEKQGGYQIIKIRTDTEFIPIMISNYNTDPMKFPIKELEEYYSEPIHRKLLVQFYTIAWKADYYADTYTIENYLNSPYFLVDTDIRNVITGEPLRMGKNPGEFWLEKTERGIKAVMFDENGLPLPDPGLADEFNVETIPWVLYIQGRPLPAIPAGSGGGG